MIFTPAAESSRQAFLQGKRRASVRCAEWSPVCGEAVFRVSVGVVEVGFVLSPEAACASGWVAVGGAVPEGAVFGFGGQGVLCESFPEAVCAVLGKAPGSGCGQEEALLQAERALWEAGLAS